MERVISELTIDGLAYRGDGVGRAGGQVVFVPLTAPGDRVRVAVTAVHRSFLRGEVRELLEASPARQDPFCPGFGRCGGCQWQHVGYAGQLAAKRQILVDALRATGADVPPLHAAPATRGYRRRARLRWRAGGGDVAVGFRRWRDDALEAVDRCPLLDEPLQRAVAQLRAQLAGLGRAEGELHLLAGGDGRVHVAVAAAGAALEPSRLLGGVVVGASVVAGGRRRVAGDDALPLDRRGVLGSAEVFAQANAAQDRRLRGEVAAIAALAAGERVLELFSGSGNLTAELLSAGGQVVAVEEVARAVELARRHLGDGGGRLELRRGDAREACEALAAAGARFELLVADPPRSGARWLPAAAAALGVARLLYVSCDPMTLARDLLQAREHGFELEALQALDMMPQTYHVEVVAGLAARRRVG